MKNTPITVRLVLAAAVAASTAVALEAQRTPSFVVRPATAEPDKKPMADKKPATESPMVEAEYRLGPGDKLRIEVYKDPQLSQSVQIRPDGKITLPLVGDLEATGRTALELRDSITTDLREYLTNPEVTVIVVEALASQVYVIGEVAKAGPLLMNGPTTILQALAMAGGFTDWANRKDVRVLRQGPSGLQTLRFNYNDAVDGLAKPFYLRAGDTIVVR
jgi:polysaccharide export outer membrane protein